MAVNGKKIIEAESNLAQAAKYMKTSFFKWKPDYDSAVSEYGKAATAFRNAKAYDRAIETYKKCAEVQKQMNSIFHAAKSLEQAAMLCKDTKEIDEAANLIERASNLYLSSGTPDTAAISLERGAKMIEETNPERAVHLLMKGVDIVDTEDRPKHAADLIRHAGRLLIRCKRLDEAVKILEKEIEFNAQGESFASLNKVVVGLVLVHLTRGDYVAADQCFQHSLRRYSSFMSSEEAASLEPLLEAYDEGDQDTANAILKTPLFKYLDNDFAKLARDIVVPGGRQKDQTQNQTVEGATSGETVSAVDDEFEDGLC